MKKFFWKRCFGLVAMLFIVSSTPRTWAQQAGSGEEVARPGVIKLTEKYVPPVSEDVVKRKLVRRNPAFKPTKTGKPVVPRTRLEGREQGPEPVSPRENFGGKRKAAPGSQ